MLLETISGVYKRMSHAAMRAGRKPDSVRLVAVTKGVDAALIRQSAEFGLRDFGESRVQAAEVKIASLRELQPQGTKISWHLIGHLQKNKAKAAVSLFDVIHSVDSIELARLLNDQAGKAGKAQRVLLQIKLSGEESKSGMPEEDILEVLRGLEGMDNMRVEGLMTIPPFFEDPEMTRPYFRRLREIRDRALQAGFGLRELSMGMTHDFEVAIEEGATMVRVGTAIFGERLKEAA